MTDGPRINITLDYADLNLPAVRPTVRSLNAWTWRWLLTGNRKRHGISKMDQPDLYVSIRSFHQVSLHR